LTTVKKKYQYQQTMFEDAFSSCQMTEGMTFLCKTETKNVYH